MVMVCQKCGDPGFAVALIYCDKCQEVAEHRYCLDVMPKTFTEYVTWLCEDCKPKDPLNDEVEICCLASKCKSSEKKKLSSRNTPRPIMISTIEDDVVVRPVGKESSLSGQTPSSTSYQTYKDGAMDVDDPKKSTTHNVPSYNNFATGLSKQNMDHTMIVTSKSEVLDRNAFIPSQPIYEPVWRGCIKLQARKFGIVDGIAAHLSTKASLQVYEEARLLSESLYPEMLPRLNIWPKGFLKSGPKDDNIGLYFFPQNERYEKEYATLVDHMIENDLAMKALGANADLLIFTSMELPLNNWRFQTKYYLWGVFRGNDASSSGSGAARNKALTSNTPETNAENENVKKSRTRSRYSPLNKGSRRHRSAS